MKNEYGETPLDVAKGNVLQEIDNLIKYSSDETKFDQALIKHYKSMYFKLASDWKIDIPSSILT
jgi:hypothetical protein